MQAEVTTAPALRRGTRAATQRVVAALRAQGFEARLRSEEWDDLPVWLVVLEGFDEVTIYAHCSESEEPDSAWRVVGTIPGMDLADVELRDCRRTSPAVAVARAIIPYLSMTRQELQRR